MAPGLRGDDGIASQYVAVLPNGPMIVLTGTASVIWNEIDDGTEESLADRVAAAVGGVAALDIEPDIRVFVDDLVAQGFLERDAMDGD
jgi:hypothetical protein